MKDKINAFCLYFPDRRTKAKRPNRREKLSYGVITGEKSAEAYAVFGKTKIKKGVIYVLATDGFTPYLKRKDFRRELSTFNKEKVEDFINKLSQRSKNPNLMSEKTLIAFRI